MVRLGIIGLGNMGVVHARKIPGMERVELTAVADSDPARLKPFEGGRTFTDPYALIASGEVDAVLIATPHFSHTDLGIAALRQGLHVLVEKPISVHKADAQRLIDAWDPNQQVFAAMFNQRTDPFYKAIRTIVQNGSLGELVRTSWIITNWFRTEAYYASGGWRATWRGEGGGVLLNQCPHNLDLFQWICGMPTRVTALCGFGKRHSIEVEDEVTAIFEYPNGATGMFVTSTGEAPGTNRLEIAGDRGKLVYESDRIVTTRNEISASEFCRISPEAFASPKTSVSELVPENHGGQHVEIIENFIAAILDGAEVIAPASEGIHSVELANAMILSGWTGKPVDLPLDAGAYESALQERIANSSTQKAAREDVISDMSKSFS